MKCIACNSSSFDSLYETKDWGIYRCTNCKLVRTKVKKLVSYDHYHRDEEYDAEKELFTNIFKKRFSIIHQYKPHKGTVLDIGASTGTMLDLFSLSGWDTWGIEPSASAQVSKNKGHTIIRNSFEKAQLQENYFDVVIINHTLEHVSNPKKSIAKNKLRT